MLEVDGVTESVTLCVFDVTAMSAIMFGRSVDVPTVDRVKGPCSSRIGLLVHLDIATHGRERHFIVIERAVEMGIHRDGGCCVGLAK